MFPLTLCMLKVFWGIIVCIFACLQFLDIDTVLFVCFITKSFLTYSFFPPTPALSTISRPLSSSMCSITPDTANVCSSYNRMRGPGIGCWFSDRSNCSHWSSEAAVLPINPNIYTDQWEPIVMYHSITFTFTGPYTTMQPTLLTYWLQLLPYKVQTITAEVVLSPLLLHPRLLETFQSDIPLFTLTWPAKLV